MKITLTIIAIILFVNCTLYGQKPNTKAISIDYIQPPLQPLNLNVKTYYSAVSNASDKFEFSISKERSRIVLSGYEKIDSRENADLIISFKINSTSYEGEVKKEVYEKQLEDKSKVKKTGGKYSVDAYLSYSISFQDVKNNIILRNEDGNVAKKTFTSKLYDTYSAAASSYKESKNKVSKDLLRKVYEEELNKYIWGLNSKYGFPIEGLGVPIARGKGKKHDYSDLVSAFDTFSIAVKQFNENNLSPQFNSLVDTCITTWQSAIKEYQPKNKKARIGDKNIGHINFNLASAFFILNEWDKAIEYLEVVSNTKGQKLIALDFKKTILDLKKRHEIQNGMSIAGQ